MVFLFEPFKEIHDSNGGIGDGCGAHSDLVSHLGTIGARVVQDRDDDGQRLHISKRNRYQARQLEL